LSFTFFKTSSSVFSADVWYANSCYEPGRGHGLRHAMSVRQFVAPPCKLLLARYSAACSWLAMPRLPGQALRHAAGPSLAI
jgi:hypothetical protein